MTIETLARLRGRLEGVRSAATESATAQELEIALAELEVLWEELQHQADLLAAERYRYAFLFEHAPSACIITDLHGVAREANRSALQLFDVPAAHLVGKPLALFVVPPDRPAFRSRLTQAVMEPNKRLDPLRLRLGSASYAPTEVEVRIQCLPASADNAVTLMCFLRPAP